MHSFIRPGGIVSFGKNGDAAHRAWEGGRVMNELVVEGNVFFGGRLVKCCISIEAGRIIDVRKVLKGKGHMDVGDRLVLPGAIDAHVHMRDPGQTAKEDFTTGTLAAAHAGVTTVLDMPNNMPPVNTPNAVQEKASHLKGRAVVDFGLFMALDTKVGPDKVKAAVNDAIALKLFLGPTVGGIGRPDDLTLEKDMAAAAEAGLTISSHCEDPRIFPKGTAEKARDLEDHDVSRPATAELASVKSLLEMGARAGKDTRLHIAHVSSEMSLEHIVKWREGHKGITCEVTPHHLFLDSSMDIGARGKTYPPIRSRANNDLLWRGLMEGDIDIVATDHAPHTMEEKSQPFPEAPAGVPGVETCLPMFLHILKRQRIDLPRLVEVFSAGPAHIFGLDHCKGAIAKGMDADLTIVDLKNVISIKAKGLHSRCGWTPYEGNEAVFPWIVMVRGEMVVQDGEVLSPAHTGRNIRQPGTNGKDTDPDG